MSDMASPPTMIDDRLFASHHQNANRVFDTKTFRAFFPERNSVYFWKNFTFVFDVDSRCKFAFRSKTMQVDLSNWSPVAARTEGENTPKTFSCNVNLIQAPDVNLSLKSIVQPSPSLFSDQTIHDDVRHSV
jgi:hypothetical protein